MTIVRLDVGHREMYQMLEKCLLVSKNDNQV